MKFANWPLTLLKALGLSVLALTAYVAFFLYAAGTFWGNSQVTVTSEQRDGLSVSLTHPAVVKGRGEKVTATVFNHTSDPITIMEPRFFVVGYLTFTTVGETSVKQSVRYSAPPSLLYLLPFLHTGQR